MTDNLTTLFLGDENTWENVHVTLWVVNGAWHGHSISVSGRGSALVGIYDAATQRQRRYDVTLGPARAHEVIRLAIAGDLMAIALPDRNDMRPDESLTTLVLSKDRRTFATLAWETDPLPTGLQAMLDAMLGLEELTRELTPIYEGPADTD